MGAKVPCIGWPGRDMKATGIHCIFRRELAKQRSGVCEDGGKAGNAGGAGCAGEAGSPSAKPPSVLGSCPSLDIRENSSLGGFALADSSCQATNDRL